MVTPTPASSAETERPGSWVQVDDKLGQHVTPEALRDMIARIDEVLADKSRARPGEWCAFERVTGTPVIPDLTRGYWPDHICNKRNRFWIELVDALPAFHVFPDGSTSLDRTVTCTRIAGHTGRHAAGSGGLIVAVWGDRP